MLIYVEADQEVLDSPVNVGATNIVMGDAADDQAPDEGRVRFEMQYGPKPANVTQAAYSAACEREAQLLVQSAIDALTPPPPDKVIEL